jgi:SAM-dependent methyltransferase
MEPMERPKDGISARVKAQYEAYPYPNYSLLLPLRSQEAYASNSLFAARLAREAGLTPALHTSARPEVLLAGCGDTLPYFFTYWEPSIHRLTAVDLSFRNLRRARLRCIPRFRPIDWRQGNLEDTGFDWGGPYAHIDCYGVLHHMADPAGALARLGEALLPGGTARIMVYNSEARAWIRHLQKAFGLLGLDSSRPEDVAAGRELLAALAAVSPALKERLGPAGAGYSNSARFVDTFLHAREARLGLGAWMRALASAGLRVLGAFDRYGELDDLPNPLLGPPDPMAWRDRIRDRRLENNFEFWLARPGPEERRPAPARRPPHPFAWKNPPSAWFSFEETSGLPWVPRRRLWAHFLERLSGAEAKIDSWAGNLPEAALQRLARLGALFPSDFADRGLQALIRAPIHASMEPPDFPAPIPLATERGLRVRLAHQLHARGIKAERIDAVLRRLEAAQLP